MRSRSAPPWFALVLVAGGSAGAQVLPVPSDADRFDRAFDAYRRIELSVPPAFQAACVERGLALRCTLTNLPDGFYRRIVALEGGVVVDVRLVAGGRQQLVLEVERRSGDVVLHQARFEGPPRWVVEAGEAAVMGAAVEDEHPFRPYPQPTPRVQAPLPPPKLEPLGGGGSEAAAFNDCLRAWQGKAEGAAETCAEVVSRFPETPAATQARRVAGEIMARRVESGEAVPLEAAVSALSAAEESTPPADRVRYTLLMARVLDRLGETERAELHLESRAGTLRGTAGERYLTVERAGVLLSLGNRPKSREMLEAVGLRPGDGPHVGRAVRALACLAYDDRTYDDAAALFATLRARWPELLVEEPETLLRAAEVAYLQGRLADARAFYDDLLTRFPKADAAGIARVRVAMLRAFTDPVGATEDFARHAAEGGDAESRHLAAIQGARLADRHERLSTLWQLRRTLLSDYLRVEVLLDVAREALFEGRLREAFDALHELWTVLPDDLVLRKAPLLFDRVLSLLAKAYLDHNRPRRVVALYYGHRPRFELHRHPDSVHLLVGRAYRRLGMYEEALTVLQRGLRGNVEQTRPDDAARVHLEMAAVLRQVGDAFRLQEVLDYLDRTHADRFDDIEYWMARGMSAHWAGRHAEARDLLRYALNGPASPEQRVELAGLIADVYEAMGDTAKTVRALEAQLTLHRESGGAADAPLARDVRWRIAETRWRAGQWAEAVAAFTTFLTMHGEDPARPEALYLRAHALWRQGDPRRAAREWDRLALEDARGPWGPLAHKALLALQWRVQAAPRVTGTALGASAP